MTRRGQRKRSNALVALLMHVATDRHWWEFAWLASLGRQARSLQKQSYILHRIVRQKYSDTHNYKLLCENYVASII